MKWSIASSGDFFSSRKFRGVGDYADADAGLADGDHPEPEIAAPDEAGKVQFLAVTERDILEMGEDGEFLEGVVGFPELEVGSDDGVAAAAIDEVTGGNGDLRPGFALHFYGEGDGIGGEIEFLDLGLLVDPGAGLGGVIEKELVEIGAFDLVGFGLIQAKTGAEVEADFAGAAGTGDLAADFFHGDGLEFLLHAEALEGVHAVGEKGFADVEAGKFFALEDDDFAAVVGEDAGGGAAGGAAADDCDVVIGLHGKGSIAANAWGMQRWGKGVGLMIDDRRLMILGGADWLGGDAMKRPKGRRGPKRNGFSVDFGAVGGRGAGRGFACGKFLARVVEAARIEGSFPCVSSIGISASRS